MSDRNVLAYASGIQRWRWRVWLPVSFLIGFVLGAAFSALVILWICMESSNGPAKLAVWPIVEWLLDPVDWIIDGIIQRSHSYYPMMLAMVTYFGLLMACASTLGVAVAAGIVRLCSRQPRRVR